MTYFGIGIDPQISNDLDAENPSKTTFLSGVVAEAQQTLAHGPLANTYYSLESDINNAEHPGKYLMPEDYENSIYKRPGLNFKFGVSETDARIAAQRYDADQKREDIINNLGNGFLPMTSKYIGQAAGFSVDPMNILSTMLAPELFGEKMALNAYKLSEMKLSESVPFLAKQFGRGAAEGTLSFLPSTVSDFQTQKYFGGSPDVLNSLMSLGLGAAIGGSIRGILGGRKIISVSGDRAAKEAALAQSLNDQKVDVSPIVKTAYNEARNQDENNILSEEIPNNINKLSLDDVDNIKDQYKSLYPNINKSSQPEESINNNIEAENTISSNPSVKINGDNVQDYIRNVNNLDNNTTVNLNDLDNLKNTINDLPTEDEQIKQLEEQYNELKNNQLLNESDQEPLDDIKDYESKIEKMHKAFLDMVACTLRRD